VEPTELEGTNTETAVIGEVTNHDSTLGQVYFKIGEKFSSKEDHVVVPFKKFLPKGQRIIITYVDNVITKIEADDT